MDDRLPEHWATVDSVRGGSVGLGPGLDMVLTSSPETPEWFLAEDIPALYVPMASDPERFRPFEEDQKRYDVSFIGSKYGLREQIVTAVMAAGIHVDAFGPGWPNGAVNADQSAEIFGRSRIVLGMGTVAHNDDLFTIKLRDFDAPMSGALYVTHRNPDLLQLYREHEEIACYLSIEECVHKLRYYLAHPDDRRRVAAAGMARARREHTWEGRLSRVFSMMGLLEAPSP
jgi:spore maturation protein CgeB